VHSAARGSRCAPCPPASCPTRTAG
jgi:hypothetical protein